MVKNSGGVGFGVEGLVGGVVGFVDGEGFGVVFEFDGVGDDGGGDWVFGG